MRTSPDMEKTPKGKSLKFVRPTEHGSASKSLTNVEDSKKQRRIWESDFCSQETNPDVEWDWNSPKHIKPKIQRVPKRQLLKSPKAVPKKSHANFTRDYEKLREELQALKDEIARVDDDCFHASPIDEMAVKSETAANYADIDSFIEEQYFHIDSLVDDSCRKLENESYKAGRPHQSDNQSNEMFDDSWDEELLKCTQMLEERLNEGANTELNKTVDTDSHPKVNIKVKASETRTQSNTSFIEEFRLQDQFQSAEDSFDAVLREFRDEDIDILTQTADKSFTPRKSMSTNSTFKRTFSDANVQYVPQKDRVVKVSKFAFHRTHSFESSPTSQEVKIPKHVMEEIERKRKEAQAKLKQKKEKQPPSENDIYSNISPMKCSPEEIEKKRLQAKAIREAKQMEIIEKNRQEAMKRLEMNRIKKLNKKFLN